MMKTPTLNERRQAWLWAYAKTNFRLVMEACELLEQADSSGQPMSYQERYVLEAGIIATYGRLVAAGCHGAGKLDINEIAVSAELRKLHADVVDFRHKLVAHLDAVGFDADKPETGNINQVRIVVGPEREWYIGCLQSKGHLFSPVELKALSQAWHEEAVKRCEAFCDKWSAEFSWKPGQYILNLEDEKGDPFPWAAEQIEGKPISKEPQSNPQNVSAN